jgi:hypothetical protein
MVVVGVDGRAWAAPTAFERERRSQGAAAPRDEDGYGACLVEHRRAAESAAAPREETPRKTWARLRRCLRHPSNLTHDLSRPRSHAIAAVARVFGRVDGARMPVMTGLDSAARP